jgi:hypothetical protein
MVGAKRGVKKTATKAAKPSRRIVGPRLLLEDHLGGLTPVVAPSTFTIGAQRFLATAYDTVSDLLSAMDVVREYRKVEEDRETKGRLSENEEDLVRAAIAFSGAGLDSSLTRPIHEKSEEPAEDIDLFA